MLILCTAVALLSAGLLFLVEPMFARMILPLLGGSPSVWNTTLVFYQVTLLGGYAYAHALTRRLSTGRQALVHVVLVAAAFASLPITVPHGWSPPLSHNPIPWMLGLLTVGIGLPFFIVSTTGPLIQRWFAASGHRSADNPYFLYAASNAGSMIGLLGYPLLIEPRLTLSQQSMLWTIGYGVLALMIAGCAWAVWVRGARAGAPGIVAGAGSDVGAGTADDPAGAADPIGAWRRWRWILLAFIPSSLMMGVTTHITTDIAAIPLLWVLPLALYLLSFIFVFAKRRLIPHAIVTRALPLVVLPVLIVMQAHSTKPIRLIVALDLLLVSVASMVCHGELANDRPPARRLTEFYLYLALGGALGGMFNALVAPVVFHSVVELPIAIVLACAVLPPGGPLAGDRRARVLDIVVPVLMAAFVVAFGLYYTLRHHIVTNDLIVVLYALLALPLFAQRRRPLRFALAIAAVLIARPGNVTSSAAMLDEERNFFGVLRVADDAGGQYHQLFHGTTLHGMQRVRPLQCDHALTYYDPRGPAGDLFRELPDRPGRHVAVAGLGAGGLATYGRPGEHWTFYEIDPAVARIAADPQYFCMLSSCRAEHRVVLGDARRSLDAEPGRFDLMVFDAYSSDAIPVHLITREAIALYADRLTPGGVLVFHLTNRYFDLPPVIGKIAAAAGFECRLRSFVPSPTQEAERAASSEYVVLARSRADFGALAADSNWKVLPARPDVRLWTDDYSSLLSVMR